MKHKQNPQYQEIKDLTHKIDKEIESFLVLIREGSWKQAEQAQIKAKTTLLKYGADLRKLSVHSGKSVAEATEKFLHNADQIVHSRAQWIDPALISRYHESNAWIHKAAA